MSRGGGIIYRCDGCGNETGDPVWWVLGVVSENHSRSTGITYDFMVYPKDYCEGCWRIGAKAIREANRQPSTTNDSTAKL